MSSIGKSEKFRQNETFKCLIQPKMEEVFRKDYSLKNRWKKDLFGNSNPIVLELGCGKGEYTIALAQLNPNINYIGIDIKGARLWKGAKFVENNNISNVRFIRTSIDFIESLFGKDEVDEIWLTFSDPQLNSPRKRLTSSMFLPRYKKFLATNGTIHLKTDSRFLHEYTFAIAKQNGMKVDCKCVDIYGDKAKDKQIPDIVTSVQTFYEKMFIKMGLKITYLSFHLNQSDAKICEPEWDVDYWKNIEAQGR